MFVLFLLILHSVCAFQVMEKDTLLFDFYKRKLKLTSKEPDSAYDCYYQGEKIDCKISVFSGQVKGFSIVAFTIGLDDDFNVTKLLVESEYTLRYQTVVVMNQDFKCPTSMDHFKIAKRRTVCLMKAQTPLLDLDQDAIADMRRLDSKGTDEDSFINALFGTTLSVSVKAVTTLASLFGLYKFGFQIFQTFVLTYLMLSNTVSVSDLFFNLIILFYDIILNDDKSQKLSQIYKTVIVCIDFVIIHNMIVLSQQSTVVHLLSLFAIGILSIAVQQRCDLILIFKIIKTMQKNTAIIAYLLAEQYNHSLIAIYSCMQFFIRPIIDSSWLEFISRIRHLEILLELIDVNFDATMSSALAVVLYIIWMFLRSFVFDFIYYGRGFYFKAVLPTPDQCFLELLIYATLDNDLLTTILRLIIKMFCYSVIQFLIENDNVTIMDFYPQLTKTFHTLWNATDEFESNIFNIFKFQKDSEKSQLFGVDCSYYDQNQQEQQGIYAVETDEPEDYSNNIKKIMDEQEAIMILEDVSKLKETIIQAKPEDFKKVYLNLISKVHGPNACLKNEQLQFENEEIKQNFSDSKQSQSQQEIKTDSTFKTEQGFIWYEHKFQPIQMQRGSQHFFFTTEKKLRLGQGIYNQKKIILGVLSSSSDQQYEALIFDRKQLSKQLKNKTLVQNFKRHFLKEKLRLSKLKEKTNLLGKEKEQQLSLLKDK